MNLFPEQLGRLRVSSVYMDYVTYYDHETGDRFEVSLMRLTQWGADASEEKVREHGRMSRYTGER